jgi:hypothetical protein
LGVASAPPELAAALRDRVSQPSPSTLGRITALLESQPKLPQRQQEAFRREWQRLDARVRAVVDNWEAPSSGYFSLVSASFEHLLKHDILSVPATVFGSRREDLSVITCLHDLVEHEERPIAQ